MTTISNQIVLSICVPTFNRAHILERFFSLLETAISNLEDKVEVLISNNASTDNTRLICHAWGGGLSKNVNFRYYEQVTNIGVVRNILFLLEKSNGKYFVFIGDDDLFENDGIAKVIAILRSDKKPSAVIQGYWQGRLAPLATGFRSFVEASALFYEYGNAYASIVDRQAALDVLKKSQLRSEIEKIVWPQTVIGFLAMYALMDRPIYITDYPIGGPLGKSHNITTKSYWTSSLYGLVRAAYLVDREVGRNWVKKAFVRLRTRGFLNHIKAILFYSLISDNSDTVGLRAELRSHFGAQGSFWAFILFISDRYPKIIQGLAVTAYSVQHFRSPLHANQKLADARKKHAASIEASKSSKQRYCDWF